MLHPTKTSGRPPRCFARETSRVARPMKAFVRASLAFEPPPLPGARPPEASARDHFPLQPPREPSSPPPLPFQTAKEPSPRAPDPSARAIFPSESASFAYGTTFLAADCGAQPQAACGDDPLLCRGVGGGGQKHLHGTGLHVHHVELLLLVGIQLIRGKDGAENF